MKHFIFFIIMSMGFAVQTQAECKPQPDPSQPQYILGIGSLMSTESRERTLPYVESAIPVLVKGHKRLFSLTAGPKDWGQKENKNNVGWTSLGVIKGKPSDKFNAMLFKIANPKHITEDLEQREKLYCRIKIPSKQIMPYKQKKIIAGEIWAYSPMPEHTGAPSKMHPIKQSYADVFMAGCIEIEENFGIEGFAETCAKTTGWGLHWVKNRNNDPRTHKISDSVAAKIDKVLSSAIPKVFHNRVEVKLED